LAAVPQPFQRLEGFFENLYSVSVEKFVLARFAGGIVVHLKNSKFSFGSKIKGCRKICLVNLEVGGEDVEVSADARLAESKRSGVQNCAVHVRRTFVRVLLQQFLAVALARIKDVHAKN